MRYFTFKGICVLDNEGQQVNYNEDLHKLIVDCEIYPRFYFNASTHKIHKLRGRFEGQIGQTAVGDVGDLLEITKNEAIDLLSNNQKGTISACKASWDLFDNEKEYGKNIEGNFANHDMINAMHEQFRFEDPKYTYRYIGEYRITAAQYDLMFEGVSDLKIQKTLVTIEADPQKNDLLTLVYLSKQNEENRITAAFDSYSANGNWFFVKPLKYNKKA